MPRQVATREGPPRPCAYQIRKPPPGYGVSTATVERRIHRGELHAEKEPHGTKYRVWVIFDDESPVETDVATPVEAHVETPGQQKSPTNAAPPLRDIDSFRSVVSLEGQLKSAQDRAKSLEELADFHRQALKDVEWRYHEIPMELRQCQQNLAAVTRALPPAEKHREDAVDRNHRRRTWWPFGRR